MVRSSTRDSCTNQSECRSTQEEQEGGATESCTKSVRGAGSIQDIGRGNRQLQIDTGRGTGPENCPPIAKKCPHRSREEEEMQGEALGLQTGRAEAKRTAKTSFRERL